MSSNKVRQHNKCILSKSCSPSCTLQSPICIVYPLRYKLCFIVCVSSALKRWWSLSVFVHKSLARYSSFVFLDDTVETLKCIYVFISESLVFWKNFSLNSYFCYDLLDCPLHSSEIFFCSVLYFISSYELSSYFDFTEIMIW